MSTTTTSSFSSKVRMCLLIPRKKGMSAAVFHSHWANVHGPLVTELLIKYGVSDYTQFHRIPHRDEAIGIPPQYDGIADFTFDRYEDMEAFYKDPFYLEQIRPDELRFIDVDNIVFSVGRDVKVIEAGKNVHSPTSTGY
ncbi:EthD domain-containing protein [Cladophialophora immunda]|nr:EthD domain-containing protein [Cladophialophora immunda]